MFDDLGTLCLLGIFIVVGLMLLSRVMRSGGTSYGGTDFSQRGPERRTIDNEEVESQGAFGRRPGGIFRRSGRTGGTSSGGGLFGGTRRSGSSGRADSPEVKSRGSFGRPKR